MGTRVEVTTTLVAGAAAISPQFSLSAQLDRSGPEAALLLCCVRRCCGAAVAEEVRERSRRDPDWTRLLAFARLHGVMPLLRAGLAAVHVPAPVEACIRAEFQRSAAASLLFAKELVRLCGLLAQAGVPVLAVKGPALAVRAFGKLTLRQCRDLDLLVAPGDIGRAFAVLGSSGYREVPPSDGETAPGRNQKHLCLVPRGRGDARRVAPGPYRILPSAFGLPFDGLWERRESVSILGALVAAPHPEDLLLMLSAHGATHCWTSLKWVCDIAGLLRRCPDLDWARLLRRAADAGGRRMLLLALSLARDAADCGDPRRG